MEAAQLVRAREANYPPIGPGEKVDFTLVIVIDIAIVIAIVINQPKRGELSSYCTWREGALVIVIVIFIIIIVIVIMSLISVDVIFKVIVVVFVVNVKISQLYMIWL